MAFDFFFYGTLIDPELRAVVAGRPVPDAEAAALEGYKRVCVRGASYPAILPDPRHRVDGVLCRGFDSREAARLSHFEGEEYGARRLRVAVSPGVAERAWVFVPVNHVPVLPRPWRFEDWARRHRRGFLAAARGYARAIPPRELEALALQWRRSAGPES